MGKSLQFDILVVLCLRAAEDATAETQDDWACEAVYEVPMCFPFAAGGLLYHVDDTVRVGHWRYRAGFSQLIIWKQRVEGKDK